MGAYRTIAERQTAEVLVTDGLAGTVQSNGLDTKGLEQVAVYLRTGIPVAGGTLDVTLEHSDDDGGTDPYTPIPGAVFSQKTDAIGQDSVHVAWMTTNVPGRKRYVRAASTVVGAGVGYPHAVVLIGAGAHDRPVVHPNGIEWKLDQTT